MQPTRAVKYTVEEAAKLTGASYPDILYWMRASLIKPAIQQARGRGTPIQLSFTDLLEIKLIQTLRETRTPLRRIRKALACVRELGHAKFGTIYLDVTSDDVHFHIGPREVISAVKKRGQLLLINGHVLLEEVKDEAGRRGLSIENLVMT